MIGIIGGSGIYEIGKPLGEDLSSSSLFGLASASVKLLSIEGKHVGFMPRHGDTHRLLPHEINYAANLRALKDSGVRWIFSLSAVGSLGNAHPGDLVAVDQFIDMTRGRKNTYAGSGKISHIAMGKPVCMELHQRLLDAMRAKQDATFKIKPSGTYVCIDGPRFSTQAESRMYQLMNGHVIGMTNATEAFLARELGMHYCSLALVTDVDSWDHTRPHVDAKQIGEVLAKNKEKALSVLSFVIKHFDPNGFTCGCEEAPGVANL